MRGAVQAIREVVAELGVTSCAPAVAGREAAAGEPSECGKEASG